MEDTSNAIEYSSKFPQPYLECSYECNTTKDSEHQVDNPIELDYSFPAVELNGLCAILANIFVIIVEYINLFQLKSV